jgi:serine/threonine protein kinase
MTEKSESPSNEKSSPSPSKAGDRLAHYRLVRPIAIGGVGTVYQALDEGLNRMVAVKVLSPERMADKGFVERFWQEAKMLAALTHPHIIQIYFIGQEGGKLFYSMELVNGFNLEMLVAEHKQFNPYEAVEFIRQAVLGLQCAHNHGIIHRDIKPANILATADGVIKVSDFGLARELHVPPKDDESEFFYGTPDYVSPEEASGLSVDHRGDIYSLGATLYHFLAGTPPYHGTPHEVLRQHCDSRPTPVRQHNPSVPTMLASILEKMMRPEREERYQTYGELLADLDQFLATRGKVQQSPRVALPPRPQTIKAPVAVVKPAASSSVSNWLIGTSLVALLVVVGWRFYQQQSATPPHSVEVAPEKPALEVEAANAWAEMETKVTDRLVAARFGEALGILQTWPSDKFEKTPAHQTQRQVRAKLIARAGEHWKATERQAQLMLDGNHFAEALALYTQAAEQYAGIIEFEDLAKRLARETAERKAQYDAAQQAALSAAERVHRQRFAEKASAVNLLLTQVGFEQAMLDFYDGEKEFDPEFADLVGQLRTEIQRLVKLKRKVIEQIRGNPYAEFEVSTAGNKVHGVLADADIAGIELRQAQEGGVVTKKRIAWADLAPVDLLRIMRHFIQSDDYEAKWALGAMMTRYAATGGVPIDGARTWLEKLNEMDPTRAAEVEPLMDRLSDLPTPSS